MLESWSVCSTSCVHSENTALITHSRTAVTAAPPAGWLAARAAMVHLVCPCKKLARPAGGAVVAPGLRVFKVDSSNYSNQRPVQFLVRCRSRF